MFRGNFATQNIQKIQLKIKIVSRRLAPRRALIYLVALRKYLPNTRTTTAVRTVELSESPDAPRLFSEARKDSPRGAAGTKQGLSMTESVVLWEIVWDCPKNMLCSSSMLPDCTLRFSSQRVHELRALGTGCL